MKPFRKILVPVDHSECSRSALLFASDVANGNGASLDILHVWSRPSYISDAVMVRHGDGGTRSLVETIEENARKDLDDFIASASLPAELRFESRLVAGDPASRILEEIAHGGYDLVVLGTHGRTGLEHLLLGSVADKVARLSPVPVLTVPRARRETSPTFPD